MSLLPYASVKNGLISYGYAMVEAVSTIRSQTQYDYAGIYAKRKVDS